MLCTPREFLACAQNKLCVTWDWCKTKMFGRDTGGEQDKCTGLPARSLQRLPVLLLYARRMENLTAFCCAAQMCIDWLRK